MKRIRSEKPKVRRERSWLELLAVDPRDPDIVRAKVIDRSAGRVRGPGGRDKEESGSSDEG